MSTQVPARAQRIYAVWSKLGDAPLTEVDFLAAILRALGRGPGAEADVSAMKFLLVSSEAVTVSSDEFGATTYQRSAGFPSHPPNGPGTPAWDRQLAELAAEEEAQRQRVDADIERNAPQNRQRAELDQHIRAVVDERMVELRALTVELRALADEVRALTGSETTQARSLRRQRAEESLEAAQNGDVA